MILQYYSMYYINKKQDVPYPHAQRRKYVFVDIHLMVSFQMVPFAGHRIF